MSSSPVDVARGQKLVGPRGRRIGTIDAVFADYLLVRTAGLPPVDLYVPRIDVALDEAGRPAIQLGLRQAYEAWHRPLKRVDHA